MSFPLRLPRPDDWHLHLRDGANMASLLSHMPRTMARAIIMPNLRPPVRTTADAVAYRERILAALPPGSDFTPLMTLYLTDNTSPEEISAARAAGVVAAKLYPAGATTNSDAGVTDVARCSAALTRMAEVGMLLCVHGEVTAPEVDIFEREPRFLTDVLAPLLAAHPQLRVVLEHITTKEAVAFVDSAGPNVAATITVHHLMYNRNGARRRRAPRSRLPPRPFTRPRLAPSLRADLLAGGIRPHRYCLPILKHEMDRKALLSAVASGSPKYFLGTDSAPHAVATKECACGAAGMFTAHAALELYAAVFEEAGCLQHLRAFSCENGPRFYGLPPNEERLPGSWVELRKEPFEVPATYTFGESEVVPVAAGTTLPLKAYVVDK
jgi:dihydroorotase